MRDAIAHQRTLLVEVACSPKSILSTEAERQFASVRFSQWSGHDLTTRKGFEKARSDAASLSPLHMWFSLPCDVWSQIQHLNMNTNHKIQNLINKRRNRLRLVTAGIVLARDQAARGGHVHWEWPKTATKGWNLRAMQMMMKDLGMVEAIAAGCAFGLKDDAGASLEKYWKIATTSQKMRQFMDRRCQGNHEHREITGSLTPKTAYYPEHFARQGVRAMIAEIPTWSLMLESISDAERKRLSVKEDFPP